MDDFLEHVQATLVKLGTVTARKMFGGLGLYCDTIFFALIADDILYLKVDDTNRADYEDLGYEGFQPFPDKPSRMNYYELPPQVLQDPRAAVRWAKKSVEIARKNPRKKKASKQATGKRISKPSLTKPNPRKTPASPKLPSASPSPKIGQLRNIGPKSAKSLSAAGIQTRADLERLGSIGAYLTVLESGEPATLNLLYALEGALLDEPLTELPEPLKERLRAAAGR